MADAFLGEWKLVSSENFEELLKELGVSMIVRKTVAQIKPNVRFEKSAGDDTWTFTTKSAAKSKTIKFRLGDEFQEETMDGRTMKCVFHLDGDKLVQTQKSKEGKVACVITREITPDGRLKTVAVAGSVTSTRVFQRDN